MGSQIEEAIAEFRAFQGKPVLAAPEIRVNDVLIPGDAIRREAQNHPAPNARAAYEAAAWALVVRELLLQEARRRNLTGRPEQGSDGRSETAEDARIGALLDLDVVTPTADEEACRRYYDNNRRKFRSADFYEVRHILIAADPQDPAARERARALAQTLIAALTREPTRFAELAAAHSVCSSKDQGGNLGQVTEGQTVPEFETFLFGLEEGELCQEPVPTRFGSHVVKLDRKIAGRILDFDFVRTPIAEYLESISRHRAIAQYIGILAGAASITGISFPSVRSPLVQ